MKIAISGILVAFLMSGCVTAGSNEPHADSPGTTRQDAGPALCKDGTAPPCNPR